MTWSDASSQVPSEYHLDELRKEQKEIEKIYTNNTQKPQPTAPKWILYLLFHFSFHKIREANLNVWLCHQSLVGMCIYIPFTDFHWFSFYLIKFIHFIFLRKVCVVEWALDATSINQHKQAILSIQQYRANIYINILQDK